VHSRLSTFKLVFITAGMRIILPQQTATFLCHVKDILELKTAGVYSVPCTCGWIYIGQTGHSIASRMEEHHWHSCPEQRITAQWQSTLSKGNSATPYTNICGSYNQEGKRVSSSRSWFRASSIIKLNKNQQDAHLF
jgi:hypothetical protein